MKPYMALVATTFLLASSATAQVSTTITANQPPSAFGTEPTFRITSVFKTVPALSDGQAVPDAKSQEAARRELYQVAERECSALMEIYKAECRLSSVGIMPFPAGPNSQSSNVMSATAVYDLRVRGGR